MKKLAFLSSLVLALGLAIGCSSGSNWVDPSIPQPIVGTEAVEISESLIEQWGNAQIGVNIPLADFGITDVSFDDGATYIISGTLTLVSSTADVTFKGMYMQNTKDWSDNAPVVLTDTIAPNVKDFSREWKGIPGVTAFQFIPQADSSLVGEKVKFTISNFKIELKEAPADTGSGSGGISSYTYISNIEIADVKDENGAKRISGNQYATFKIGTGVFKAGDKLIFGFAEAPKGVNFIFVDNDTADSDITDNGNWFGWKQATDTTSGIHYINLDKATYEYTFTKDTFVTREVDFAGNKKNVSHDVSFQLQNNDSTALLTAAIYIPAASNTAGAETWDYEVDLTASGINAKATGVKTEPQYKNYIIKIPLKISDEDWDNGNGFEKLKATVKFYDSNNAEVTASEWGWAQFVFLDSAWQAAADHQSFGNAEHTTEWDMSKGKNWSATPQDVDLVWKEKPAYIAVQKTSDKVGDGCPFDVVEVTSITLVKKTN